MSESGPSLIELLGRLKDDTLALAKAEVALAKADVMERARVVRGALVPAVVALALLHAGLLALTAALIVGLGHAMDESYGLAAAIVGGVFVVAAGGVGFVVARMLRGATTAGSALVVPGKHAVEVIHDRSEQG